MGDRQKKKKAAPWLSSSRSERIVLQCRWQPAPTQPIPGNIGGGGIIFITAVLRVTYG